MYKYKNYFLILKWDVFISSSLFQYTNFVNAQQRYCLIRLIFYLNAHSATQDVPRVARDGANTYPWDIQ